jgi:DNA-binding NtrC family response regulator
MHELGDEPGSIQEGCPDETDEMKGGQNMYAARLGSHGELPVPPPPAATPVTVMLVSPDDDDWHALRRIFRHTNWRLHRALGYEDAARGLRTLPISVLVTAKDLPKGRTWRDLLESSSAAGKPRVVVAAEFQDDPLWAEVLNLGGYDVLMQPFDREEVVRVVSLAWLNWRDEQELDRADQQLKHGASAAI